MKWRSRESESFEVLADIADIPYDPPARDFFYYISYHHENGWGSANPYRSPRQLKTANAITTARRDIAASIGRDPDSIVLISIVPLETERWIPDAHREAESRLAEGLREAGLS